jgi:hypothetical protein
LKAIRATPFKVLKVISSYSFSVFQSSSAIVYSFG